MPAGLEKGTDVVNLDSSFIIYFNIFAWFQMITNLTW